MSIVEFCKKASEYTYETEDCEYATDDPVKLVLDEICELFGGFEISPKQEYVYLVQRLAEKRERINEITSGFMEENRIRWEAKKNVAVVDEKLNRLREAVAKYVIKDKRYVEAKTKIHELWLQQRNIRRRIDNYSLEDEKSFKELMEEKEKIRTHANKTSNTIRSIERCDMGKLKVKNDLHEYMRYLRTTRPKSKGLYKKKYNNEEFITLRKEIETLEYDLVEHRYNNILDQRIKRENTHIKVLQMELVEEKVEEKEDVIIEEIIDRKIIVTDLTIEKSRTFQQGIDVNECRQKRVDTRGKLRKELRTKLIQDRREKLRN